MIDTPSLEQLIELLKTERSLLIEELWDAPKALLLSHLQKLEKNILIVSGEMRENCLLSDLAYFGISDALDFPSWETLPSDEMPSSPDITGKRWEILHTLLNKKKKHVILAPLQACLQMVISPALLKKQCFQWRVGHPLNFAELPAELTELGYRRSTVASDKGEFAVRGGIIDIFPVSSTDPYRIEFFGDVIEQIRTYDPLGQKSTAKVDHIFLSPANEIDILKSDKKPTTILDYIGDAIVIFDDLLALEDRYVAIYKPSPFFLSFEGWMKSLGERTALYWTKERIEELSETSVKRPVGRSFYTKKTPLQPLEFQICDQTISAKRWQHSFVHVPDMRELQPYHVNFICSTEAEERTLKEKLSHAPTPKSMKFDRGYLSSGILLPEVDLALFPMTELTHRFAVRRQKWRTNYHTPTSDYHEIAPGDVVVHFHQGIAKYLGMEKKPNYLGQESEFLVLEFAESSKLYVPLTQSHLVSRYIGAKEEIPKLNTLGSTRWEKMRGNAQKAIIGYANDLLKMQAEREIQGGAKFPPDTSDMEAFEAEFPFVETEDQMRAIVELKVDMCSEKAMDRLICGDVGYGKTEVAMRAAFKAAYEGKKQVAVLVPTTVLAMQHYETFCARMANFPLNIALLSRLRTPKEIKKTLELIKSGAIDIVIGTHRVISKDVQFHDLGLMIIDEEQRFGVRAKEHLKKLKVGVDCLILSATPIPRTLYMTLVGAKDISIISTPPQDRLPIKTIIAEKNSDIIKTALLRELSRDGQAFFIHNRVESIYGVAEELKKMLPEARIVIAHGQMDADEADAIFRTFKEGDADILVATTIVENGVDIPNANTILIDRADQFGLADLYQLRGRVGRWNRPAYTYFLISSQRTLPELSRKRLHALAEASGYGGGMKIAMRDLEIRGTGDILGTEQSGQIASIGFHLYCKLLKRAIEALRKKKPLSFTETKIEFPYNASLPEEYIAETSLRMEIYYRLGESTSFEEVDAILAELQDRFGAPPPPVIWLYHLTRLKIFAAEHHFTHIRFEQYVFSAELRKDKKILSQPRTKKPAEWEKEVLNSLREAFKLF